MPFNLGDSFPDFSCDTDQGRVDSIHAWMGDSWMLFFSHPADFTPVCTTELGAVAKASDKFTDLGVQLIALSVDNVKSHEDWKKDIEAHAGVKEVGFPIIADENRELAKLLGMLDPEEKDCTGVPVTCRAVFLVDPSKKVKFIQLYPATTGRCIDELYRVTASILMTAKHPVATPVNWYPTGDKVFVQPNVSLDEANQLFNHKVDTKEVPSGKTYLRYVAMPHEFVVDGKVSGDNGDN